MALPTHLVMRNPEDGPCASAPKQTMPPTQPACAGVSCGSLSGDSIRGNAGDDQPRALPMAKAPSP